MPLTDLPSETLPREKLLARGVGALSDVELLAILLRTGLPGKNVLQLSEELLVRFGGITGLLHTDLEALKSIKGLGPAKRAEVVAVLELSRRALSEQLSAQPVFDHPSAMQEYLQLRIGAHGYEAFTVVFLDTAQRLIACEELFRGTLGAASVYPREVVIRALHHGAASVVLAHNHPSGELQASAADIALTGTLRAALALVDVQVLDHIIVSKAGTLSMVQAGLM